MSVLRWVPHDPHFDPRDWVNQSGIGLASSGLMTDSSVAVATHWWLPKVHYSCKPRASTTHSQTTNYPQVVFFKICNLFFESTKTDLSLRLSKRALG